MVAAAVPVGRLRGHPAAALGRLPRDDAVPARGGGARLLGRPAPRPALLGEARLVQVGRLRRLEPGRLAARSRSLLLPAVALGLFQFAVLARTTRSAVLEVLREEYVKTARAKGVAERARALPPRAPQRDDPHHHRGGHPARPAHGGQHHAGVRVLPARPRAARPRAPSARATCRWCRASCSSWPAMIVTINVAVDLLYGFLDPRIRYE